MNDPTTVYVYANCAICRNPLFPESRLDWHVSFGRVHLECRQALDEEPML